MKHQQVVIDYWTMLKTSFTYLILVAGLWFMFRLFHAVYWFPRILKAKHEEIARRLEYHARRLNVTLPKDVPEHSEQSPTETPAEPSEEAKKEK